MAIAYYIPDQAKLLAGGRASRETVNNNRNTNNATNSTNPQRPTSNAAGEQNPAVNRGYGTTINLTVPTYATAQEPAGCWDFLTQVFCHALRFYHESSQLQPTVIQISVNFQSQAAENPTATGNSATSGNSTATATTATATATATQRNTTPDHTLAGSNSTGTNMASSISATTNSPTAHLKQEERQHLKAKKSGKRKN